MHTLQKGSDPWECLGGERNTNNQNYNLIWWAQNMFGKRYKKSNNLVQYKIIRESLVSDLMLTWNCKGEEVDLLLDKIIRSGTQWSCLWRAESDLLQSIRVQKTKIWHVLNGLRRTMHNKWKGQTKRQIESVANCHLALTQLSALFHWSQHSLSLCVCLKEWSRKKYTLLLLLLDYIIF